MLRAIINNIVACESFNGLRITVLPVTALAAFVGRKSMQITRMGVVDASSIFVDPQVLDTLINRWAELMLHQGDPGFLAPSSGNLSTAPLGDFVKFLMFYGWDLAEGAATRATLDIFTQIIPLLDKHVAEAISDDITKLPVLRTAGGRRAVVDVERK
jgi:hypothetical protein